MTGPGARVRTVLLAGLVLALVVQVVVLYAPEGPGQAPFAGADKVVHLTVFLVPTVLALLARLPVRGVVPALAAHAVVSEVVQGTLLPDRSGDLWDAVADLVGVGIGVLLARAVERRRVVGSGSTRW
ncbi:VanZ family protein [Phycicoccus sp. CSK15P-2]|uniref:VanZ family protein n=1 Tax=Phycicoccus sp. CSK15P-2 TaxID=2807627 RepID=UPI0019527791|nr:VanZ family protein [Phycicoccus sp. CSK15P-2]MBM6404345.1 VanZ family protein [Phycicoccus sp. CSK15P-2]